MRRLILFVSVLVLFFAGCSPAPTSQYSYQPPEQTDDGLNTGKLGDVNIDSALIEQAVAHISDGHYGEVHAMLVFKDKQLVLEEYFMGHKFKWDGANYHGTLLKWNRDKEHTVMSVSKSVTSAAIGLAIKNGFIESVDQSIFDYLPDYQYLNTDGKGEITIEHLLTMTSGLEWNEWGASNTSPDNDLFKLWVDCDDQVVCVLGRPLVHEPGTDFTYNGGGILILGEIIRNATGMDIIAFTDKYLFEPMGIAPRTWDKFESGVIFTSSSLALTPREMVKFGAMYLSDGVWDGQQIVTEQWVEKSANNYSGPGNSWYNSFFKPIPPDDNTRGKRGYTYTWWTHEFSHSGSKLPMYYANGWGGQDIMVFPDLDTVIVFTGGNYTSNTTTFEVVTDYILPAIEG